MIQLLEYVFRCYQPWELEQQINQIYDEFNFEDHPEAIYDMDEVGVYLKPRPPKVVADK